MLWSTILLALGEMRRNVLRSSLTILGVVIGVAAVITMVTLGRGATLQVTEQISALGTNVLIVRPGQFRGPGGAAGAAEPFDMADAEAIASEIGAVRAVAPVASRAVTAVYANENRSTTVSGTTNDYLVVRNWPLAGGRTFTESELRGGRAVCLLGATVRSELFGPQDPLGERIRLGKLSCQVVGLLADKGQASMGGDQDDIVLVPLRTLQRRITGNRDLQQIQVAVREGFSTAAAKSEIEALLRQRRSITLGEDDDFRVMDLTEIRQALTGTTRVLTALLGAVAAVSLLVGGIGIMNIMLVSVTERTREIGVRLAIGALEREVLVQFLVEAVVLTSCGGLAGISLALAGSFALTTALAVPFVVDPTIIVVAFLFSALVGVVFGFFPARKAAGMDPIEALRHE